MDFYFVWTPGSREPRERYLWEIFPCTDGLLFSKGNINSKLAEKIIDYGGINRFLRWKGPIIGDSGAWLYKNEDEPPFSVRDLLDYYIRLGIPTGAHLDHSILKTINVDGMRRELTPKEKKKRWNINIENARETIELLSKAKFNGLEIIGVVQGWDLKSYRESTRELLKMGYEYLGIGGIARRPTSQLKKIVEAVNLEIDTLPLRRRKRIRIHLFGFGRLYLIPIFMKKRVVSFDTASPQRQAWQSGDKNYHFADPWRSYTAIRIRLTRIRKNRSRLKKMEEETLETMYAYGRKEVSMEETLEKLLEYETKILKCDGITDEKKIDKIKGLLRKRYLRTLKDRPWEKCDCPICNEKGIDVIIFREGWRNGARASHDVRQFYLELDRIREMVNND